MSDEYVLDRLGDGGKNPSPPRLLKAAKAGLKQRMAPHNSKGWQMHTRVHPKYGMRLPALVARLRAWVILQRGDTGTKVFLKSFGDGVEFAVTKVTDEPNVIDLGCAPELEKIHAYALEWGRANGGIRSGGRWYCRFVLGTRTVSKHGYVASSWKGSAEDWFVVADTMAKLEQFADFMIGLAERGEISPATIIVADSEWNPGVGRHHYSGEFHRHVHIDVPGGWPCNP